MPLAQVWYPPDDVYFFVKVFDPETQTLNLHGSFCAPSKVRLKDVALKLCRLANQASAEVWWEEREIVGDEFVPVRHLHNVPAERMIDGLILIVVPKPITSPDIRATLTARAFLLTLKSYVAAIYRRINYPDLVDGQFTLTYFSKEPFAGYLVHGRPHGRGKTISFTGDVYEGDFALGARQGSGKLTYANGNVYDGTWVDDKRDGHGRLLDVTTGNEYIGGWRGDRHFGSGVTTWKTAQEVEKLCRICWDTVADAALYDCGHVLACLTCARQVDRCPICRKRVLTALKLYFAIA